MPLLHIIMIYIAIGVFLCKFVYIIRKRHNAKNKWIVGEKVIKHLEHPNPFKFYLLYPLYILPLFVEQIYNK